jgi:hypothetical protein
MKTIALGILMALGAFAQKIEIESDATVDFSKFKTFAIGMRASTAPIRL